MTPGGDQGKGALPFSGSSQTPPASQQPPAQPAQPPAQEPENGSNAPEHITREEFLKWQKEQDTRIFQTVQKFSDVQTGQLRKAVQRQTEQIKASIEELKAAGATIPDNLDINAMALDRALKEPSSGQVPAEPNGLEARPGDPSSNPETAWASDYEQLMGVTFDVNDPEDQKLIAEIKTDGTPQEYRRTYKDAVDKKAARIASAGEQPAAAGGAGNPGQLPAGGGGSSVDLKRDPADLISDGFAAARART